jgi:hypothetical protein
MQSSIVGLAQALTMFAGTFNKVRPAPMPRLVICSVALFFKRLAINMFAASIGEMREQCHWGCMFANDGGATCTHLRCAADAVQLLRLARNKHAQGIDKQQNCCNRTAATAITVSATQQQL